jgi:hypothetical protein
LIVAGILEPECVLAMEWGARASRQ